MTTYKKLIDLQTKSRSLGTDEKIYTLPNPTTRLGEATTELLSIVFEHERVRWGHLEVWFMQAAGLSKASANRRLKHLASMGIIDTWKIEDKTWIRLTNRGESVLEVRQFGINAPIRFSYRPQSFRNW